jgi:ADP-ribosylglycohydrolase
MAAAPDNDRRVRLMADSLCGLRVGDALGSAFFGAPDEVTHRIRLRELPSTAAWTDDTLMASSLAAVLVENNGALDENELITHFARHFDIQRGYGDVTRELLYEVRLGRSWRPLVDAAHNGDGSWGNGAAMRVAPLGAYWSDERQRVVALARLQAGVTHGHHEAAEGAVAVAVAASLAVTSRGAPAPSRAQFLKRVTVFLRPGRVLHGLEQALRLGDVSPDEAAFRLGTGRDLAAFDTVPFALWSAAGHLDDFESAFWATVAAAGERDTTCAIVGGIVGARVGIEGIPDDMIERVEPLPAFVPGEVRRAHVS